MSKRMEWPLKTAQKEILKAFDQFVIENKSFLENKKLLVWGASVRGTLLGMILEKKGLIDFLYIDNDERKWGNHINGHSILNPNEVRNQLQNTFILIPVEYPEEICKQLYSWGLKEDSFAVIKSNIEKSYTEELRVLTKREKNKLEKYCKNSNTLRDIGIVICLNTGLRIGEICALRWEDISLSEQTIYIHQTLQRIQNLSDNIPKTKIIITTPKSACSIRTIPLPDELYNILIKHQKPSRGYLLTNDDNKFIEPRTLQNRFKKILKDIHIADTNFHTLRHTFATRCIELGFDIKSLSEILGHATVNITMNRYVHPTLEMKKENMQKLSHFLAVK